MIRDLTEAAIGLVKQEQRAAGRRRRRRSASPSGCSTCSCPTPKRTGTPDRTTEENERRQRTRDKMQARLEAGELEDRMVELTVEQKAVPVQIFSNLGMENMDVDFQSMFEKHHAQAAASTRQVPIKRGPQDPARAGDRGADRPRRRSPSRRSSWSRTRASSSSTSSTRSAGRQSAHGPDVSRQGVQRDLLPVVEGTTVNTKHGPVKTDHILFIAAGAFHVVEAVRPDARAAGPLPDPRRADRPDARRLPAHPDRAEARADQAVRRAAGDRGRDAGVHAGRRSRRWPTSPSR